MSKKLYFDDSRVECLISGIRELAQCIEFDIDEMVTYRCEVGIDDINMLWTRINGISEKTNRLIVLLIEQQTKKKENENA